MFHIIFSSLIKGSAQVGGIPYMSGDLPNEGLNSTVEQLFEHAMKMTAEN